MLIDMGQMIQCNSATVSYDLDQDTVALRYSVMVGTKSPKRGIKISLDRPDQMRRRAPDSPKTALKTLKTALKTLPRRKGLSWAVLGCLGL